MRLFSAASTILFLLVWSLLVVSFATGWYHVDTKNRDGDMVRMFSFYPTKVKISNYGIEDGNVSYKDFQGILSASNGLEINFSFKPFINASFAMAIIAWIVCTVQIGLQIMDTLGKNFVPIVGRFLGFVVFALTLISFIVYVRFKPILNEDCKKVYSNCNVANYGVYSESFIGKNDSSRWGSGIGWNSVLASCIFALFTSIYNVFFFNKSTA
ncbi:hypothetical protein DICPUDRAFT_74847 [Dictyostelium purpureum]|uniref:MARVEL domain-containing protein n=1 Tax=Dictyostelium purpureum TaxID=5786 RepID=F0Z8X2_DICPU|nr:uncharacterized protein DICPUDRAFT_74847 [Dictyostelium purpureum]EGC39651.1 hypothetical protein DICPUDRAFT_74847 [Dictyostelium purpureum]|eukprot:XP_003283872.1 hypothetical protein DICPUDRAFT_74847 [Dictyostelium purpureum]